MPRSLKPVSSLLRSDLAIFYEDGGVAITELARLHRIRVPRVQEILRSEGVAIKKHGGSSNRTRAEKRPPFTQEDALLAFRNLTAVMTAIDPSSSVTRVPQRHRLLIACNSIDALVNLADAIAPEEDEDRESLWSSMKRRWRITGELVAPDSEQEGWSAGFTLSIPLKDLPRIGERLRRDR